MSPISIEGSIAPEEEEEEAPEGCPQEKKPQALRSLRKALRESEVSWVSVFSQRTQPIELPDDLYMGLRIQVKDKQGTVAGRPTTTAGLPALFFFLAFLFPPLTCKGFRVLGKGVMLALRW
jgi:hypothetical protein